MPYLAELERAGIPTVLVTLEDLHNLVEQEALLNGVPHIRYLAASRTLAGPEDVERWLGPMLDGLTRPLTDEEKRSGLHNPAQPRVLFQGTLEEAEIFYQQTRYIAHPVDAALSVYTDGLPVVLPTEERVREMLKGTSHRPQEVLTLQADVSAATGETKKKGELVLFQPSKRMATVEQVAVNAVMAGCKPEHLPVVLAIAQSGCPTGTTVFWSQAVCVSGPVVKELGMNVGVGMLGPGSPVNGPIGRAYQLMAINLGGAIPGVNRMSNMGSPINNGGACFAENAAALPPGWKGLNEELGFSKDESIVMTMNMTGGVVGSQFSPGGYRALQKSGHGGLARRFGVKGKPGPHNWLEYLVPGLWTTREGGYTFIMVPELARHLYEIGFKSKDEVYDWMWKKSFEPLGEYRKRSWPDFVRNGWLGTEARSGQPWKDLPDDYMVPVAGDDPSANCIIVAGGDEEASLQFGGGRERGYSVDAWR